MLDKLTIMVSKTSLGTADYVQIASPGALPVNIVLIAGEIEIEDRRPLKSGKKKRPAREDG